MFEILTVGCTIRSIPAKININSYHENGKIRYINITSGGDVITIIKNKKETEQVKQALENTLNTLNLILETGTFYEDSRMVEKQ